MSTLLEVEKAVSLLSREDFHVFCDWFETLESKRWEENFADDVNKGLLDDLANEALADFDSGKFREI